MTIGESMTQQLRDEFEKRGVRMRFEDESGVESAAPQLTLTASWDIRGACDVDAGASSILDTLNVKEGDTILVYDVSLTPDWTLNIKFAQVSPPLQADAQECRR